MHSIIITIPLFISCYTGLQLYSIFYRKDLGDNKYQYNIQTEDKSKSLIVQLAGIRQNKDPFDDVYDIDVQLDDSEKSIIGIRIDYHCVIQRC